MLSSVILCIAKLIIPLKCFMGVKKIWLEFLINGIWSFDVSLIVCQTTIYLLYF